MDTGDVKIPVASLPRTLHTFDMQLTSLRFFAAPARVRSHLASVCIDAQSQITLRTYGVFYITIFWYILDGILVLNAAISF